MKTLDITEKGKKLCDFVTEKTMQGDLSNNDLVQLIEVAGAFLNLQKITDYANLKGLSYNGVTIQFEDGTIGVYQIGTFEIV